MKYLLPFFCFLSLAVHGQNHENFWQFGGGYNFVDDSGPGTSEYFNFKEMWHAVPYPSRVTAGYYLRNGFGFEAIGSYNQYKTGKLVDGEILPEDQAYAALDATVRFHINRILFESSKFDPYLLTGLGNAWVGEESRSNYSVGGGFNIWFSRKIALNLNSMAKFSLFMDRSNNHLQHSLGVVYKPGR